METYLIFFIKVLNSFLIFIFNKKNVKWLIQICSTTKKIYI